MDPKLVTLDAPGPESGITVADVREVIRRLRENVAEFPGLGFLLDNVPDQYDPEKKLAVFLAGLVNLGPRVSRAEKERALSNLHTIFNRAAEGFNERLLAGSISVDAWEAGIREELKAAHVSAYSAGRSGSWDTISFSEWGRLGQRMRRQYQFLSRFAGDIRAQGAEAFTPAYLDNRTSLYADNLRESLEAGISRDRGLDPSALPAMPADGSTKCLTRCKCRWTIRTAGRRFWQVLPYYLELARCVMLRAVISRATAARYGRNSTYRDSFGVLHVRGIIEDQRFDGEAVLVDSYTVIRRCIFNNCTVAMGGDCSSMEETAVNSNKAGDYTISRAK